MERNVYVLFMDNPVMQGAKQTEHGIGCKSRRVGHCDAAIQDAACAMRGKESIS